MAATAHHHSPRHSALRRNEGDSSASSSPRCHLPSGSCNFRDLKTGPKAPACGCRRFWRDEVHPRGATSPDAELQRREDADRGSKQAWCMCGHHACFHDFADRWTDTGSRPRSALPLECVTPGVSPANKAPVYVQISSPASIRRLQLVAGSQPVRLQEFGKVREEETNMDLAAAAEMPMGCVPSLEYAAQVPSSDGRNGQSILSDVSTSHLPRVPSQCFVSDHHQSLSSREDPFVDRQVQDINHNNGVGPVAEERGLGVTMPEDRTVQYSRVSSANQTEFAGNCRSQAQSYRQNPQSPSAARPRSGSTSRASPNPAFMHHVLENRVLFPRLSNTSPQLPGGRPFEDLLLSATEVATPSNANTPDLGTHDQAVQGAKPRVTDLHGKMATAVHSLSEQRTREQRSTPHLGDSTSSQAALRFSAAGDVVSLHQALRSTLPYLMSLTNQLNAYPNVGTAIETIKSRLEALENASFSHVPADEMQDKFDLFDGRLIDVEGRLEDQEKLHSEAPHGKHSLCPAEGGSFMSNGSFRSAGSLHSTSSSALIAAAIERTETAAKISTLEQRLLDLEASAPPSYARPWEVEVVLLPWGRDLKGIWFSPDDSARFSSKSTTQDSEEWTQSRLLRSAEDASQLLRNGRNGWSNKDILHWADTTTEWLSAKACGTNGLVYQRLKSRGFVRKVLLNGPGARSVQPLISAAFGDLLEQFSCASGCAEEEIHSLNSQNHSYLGLAAPLIPLRKVHKSSRLLFLSRPEMVTPTLWTAEFLASSVFMRAAGGQKRLFVTNREAYLQRTDAVGGACWTWQRIRELPRVHLSEDGSEVHEEVGNVGEGDAKEACWVHHPGLDPPPSHTSSAHGSFNAESTRGPSLSGQQDPISLSLTRSLSFRPTEQTPQNSQSSQQLSGHPVHPVHPISPLSEFPLDRPVSHHVGHYRPTVPLPAMSTSTSASIHNPLTLPPTVPINAKRTTSSSPSKAHRTPRPKRRRVTGSRSRSRSRSRSSGPEGRATARAWGFTPRRSREPASPLFASLAGSSLQATGESRSQPAGSGARTGAPGMYMNFGGSSGGGGADMADSSSAGGMGGTAGSMGGLGPGAYATPYSGTVLGIVSGAGSLERDRHIGAESEHDEDVWEGVGDDADGDGGVVGRNNWVEAQEEGKKTGSQRKELVRDAFGRETGVSVDEGIFDESEDEDDDVNDGDSDNDEGDGDEFIGKDDNDDGNDLYMAEG